MTGDAVTPGLVPLPDRFFDDYVPGLVGVFGAEPVSEAEILDFAARFDPQSIHTDALAAAGGPFNGLIASGWHTMALMMGVLVRYYLNEAASLASPGVDELRWLKPVRPGMSSPCAALWCRHGLPGANRTAASCTPPSKSSTSTRKRWRP